MLVAYGEVSITFLGIFYDKELIIIMYIYIKRNNKPEVLLYMQHETHIKLLYKVAYLLFLYFKIKEKIKHVLFYITHFILFRFSNYIHAYIHIYSSSKIIYISYTFQKMRTETEITLSITTLTANENLTIDPSGFLIKIFMACSSVSTKVFKIHTNVIRINQTLKIKNINAK